MTNHDIEQIYHFVFFIGSSFFICLIMLLCGYILGGRSKSKNRNIPFESGVNSYGKMYLQVPIQFSLFAVLFVVFDVEACYLYLWSVSIIEVGWFGFFEILFFVLMFLITIMYLINTNMLKWILSCR